MKSRPRIPWSQGLVARLLGVSIGLSLLTLAVVAGAAFVEARRALRRSEFARLETVAAAKAGELDRWVNAQRTQVELLAALPALPALRGAGDGDEARPRIASVLGAAVAHQRELRELFVLRQPGGRVVLSTDPSHEGEYRLGDEYYQRGLHGTFVQNVYASPTTGRPAMTISTPIRDAHGVVVGVLAAHLDLGRLDAILGDRTGLGATGESYLVDPVNQLVSGTRFGSTRYRRGVHSEGIAAALAGNDAHLLTTSYAGVPVVGVYRWMPSRQLALVVEVHQDEAFAPARRMAARVLALGLLSALGLVAGIWATTRRVVRPILALTDAAADVARGDLERAVPVSTRGEVGVLAQAFNDMTRRVREMYGELADRAAENRRAAEALRDSQQLLQSILAHSSALVTVKDLDGRYVLANEAFLALAGRADVRGASDAALFPPETADALRRHDADVRAGAAPRAAELALPRGGDVRTFLAVGFPLFDAAGRVHATCCVATDITERERAAGERRALEAQVQHAQRLDSLGRLAGGVAHDFNNLLTALRGHAEFALGDLPPGDARDDVGEIIRVADRAAGLTRQLLAFSRKQVLQPRVVDANEAVVSVEMMLDRILGEHVRLATALHDEPARVLVDPGQLEQVLVNLAVNARDAMPDGGRLTLRSRVLGGDALPDAAARRELAGRAVVLLEVADTGLGMDAETRARAFEPFYTTKGEGRGTGLGLATVYGIVEQSGGAIWIDSVPGAGTTVSVALPCVGDAVDGAVPGAGDVDAADARAPGVGTVLLAEDADSVRALAARVLRRAGYAVVETANGSEALAAWRSRRAAGQSVDLVLSDVVMPDCGGPELARHLRAADAGVPIVLMSGYLGGGVEAAALPAGVPVLEKPFTAERLLSHVADAIASAARAAA